MARILIVEDEAHLATGIKFNLEAEGYDAEIVGNGRQALERLEASQGQGAFDLVILDVMLPGMDGFTLADTLREARDFTPILMLTAKGSPEDVVHGLEVGADDYLPKPFDLKVLLARVRGLLRRREWAQGENGLESTRIGEAEVDFRSFEVHVRGTTSRLTLLEAMLLKLLVQNAGRVVSKAEILEKVWNVHPDTQTRAVDNFIVRLRRHIETTPRFPKYIQTVRGAGYMLVLPEPRSPTE
jgi:DNA-binding response OmpR family regulator